MSHDDDIDLWASPSSFARLLGYFREQLTGQIYTADGNFEVEM